MVNYSGVADNQGFLFTLTMQGALAATFALILHNHLARRKFALG